MIDVEIKVPISQVRVSVWKPVRQAVTSVRTLVCPLWLSRRPIKTMEVFTSSVSISGDIRDLRKNEQRKILTKKVERDTGKLKERVVIKNKLTGSSLKMLLKRSLLVLL